jgi:hypothetical protein
MVATHPEVSHGGRRRPSPSYAAGMVPDECDRPLDIPPATAETLVYRDDLAGVRDFTATSVRRPGLIPRRVGDLVIAVGELAANTFAHTSGPEQADPNAASLDPRSPGAFRFR